MFDFNPKLEGKSKTGRKDYNEKEVKLKHGEENSFKGIENAIQEGNQELINALIMKKVKAHFENHNDEPTLKSQQLKLQVKMIAESIILRFKGLKGFVSEVFIQSQVEMVLKKLKMKKAQLAGVFKVEKGFQGNFDEEKTMVDYTMIEATLLKNFEQAIEECHVLTSRLTELNHQNFSLKKELAQQQAQVILFQCFFSQFKFKKMEKTFKNMEIVESMPRSPPGLEKTPKKGVNAKHRNSSVKEASNEIANMAFDYIKSQVFLVSCFQ